MDKIGDSLPRILIICCCLERQLVEAAHRVRVFSFIEALFRVDDLLWLLGRRAIVKIDEASVEDREVA